MPDSTPRVATGIKGLDDILLGGLPANHLYLVDGTPGVGKTTLALQFLLEGIARGETCLYITLSETKRELESVAHSHGWSLEGIRVVELAQVESSLGTRGQNTLFQASEVELFDLSRLLLGEFDRQQPARMVLEHSLVCGSPATVAEKIEKTKTVLTRGESTKGPPF